MQKLDEVAKKLKGFKKTVEYHLLGKRLHVKVTEENGAVVFSTTVSPPTRENEEMICLFLNRYYNDLLKDLKEVSDIKESKYPYVTKLFNAKMLKMHRTLIATEQQQGKNQTVECSCLKLYSFRYSYFQRLKYHLKNIEVHRKYESAFNVPIPFEAIESKLLSETNYCYEGIYNRNESKKKTDDALRYLIQANVIVHDNKRRYKLTIDLFNDFE